MKASDVTDPELTALTVAAVQMPSQAGRIPTNLEHASALVEEAALAGAQVILLPELMPTGYSLTRDGWGAAEPSAGPTVTWLRLCAEKFGAWIGTSFLEAAGDDFFNTFVLIGPDGTEAGRVRKQAPSIWEAYFFKGEYGPHVIQTALGRIGVGICFDSHLASVVRSMQSQSVDLVLMPHCYPTPTRPTKIVSEADIARLNETVGRMAPLYGRLLGVPAVVANHCGSWESPVPRPFPKPRDYAFPGRSTIADSDGTIKGQLGAQEGVIVAKVTLDPSRKTTASISNYGRWIYPGPPGREALRLVEGVGRISYTLSLRRRRWARHAAAVEGAVRRGA